MATRPIVARSPVSAPHDQHGVSLIEILVTLVVLAVGMLGLIGLLVQSQRSQVESYQRAQALLVLDDMVNRINTNRRAADCYAVSTDGSSNDGTRFLGTGAPSSMDALAPGSTSTANFCGVADTSLTPAQIRARQDLREWSGVLLGSSERSGGSDAGVMIGARGCIERLPSPADTYRVVVAWQGIGPTAVPQVGNCAAGTYPTDDRFRRAVAVTLQVSPLN